MSLTSVPSCLCGFHVPIALEPERLVRRRAPALAVVRASERCDRELAEAVAVRRRVLLLGREDQLGRVIAVARPRAVVGLVAGRPERVVHELRRRGLVVELAARVGDRVGRRRRAHRRPGADRGACPRSSSRARRRARDPGDPLAVDLHVVRVEPSRRRCGTGRSAAATSTGFAGSRMSVTMIGRPPGQFGERLLLRVRRRGAARPEVVAAVDARRGMAGRQLVERHHPEVPRDRPR